MLIRLVAKNIFSIKEQIEFNLLTNKSQQLAHHKRKFNDISFLRMCGIYGANGSGKSSLVNALSTFDQLITEGEVRSSLMLRKFRLDPKIKEEPISLAVEIIANNTMYYYALSIGEEGVLYEQLSKRIKKEDIVIFERIGKEGAIPAKISFPHSSSQGVSKEGKLDISVYALLKIVEEKFLKPKVILLSFLGSKFSNDFPDLANVYNWFTEKLIIIGADTKAGGLSHYFEQNKPFQEFSNNVIKSLNTGIHRLGIERKKVEPNKIVGGRLAEAISRAKESAENISTYIDHKTQEEISIEIENEDIFINRLVPYHIDSVGDEVSFPMSMESDGTKRLVEYLPAFEGVISSESVYIIDEIERSIHPVMIKEIMRKISSEKNVKGQIIFTTHESSLLDQEILRPDEIWFVQKNPEGASEYYSLSDFNVHNTASIENGYLNGRYGAIPFLSSLKDLNWENDIFESK